MGLKTLPNQFASMAEYMHLIQCSHVNIIPVVQPHSILELRANHRKRLTRTQGFTIIGNAIGVDRMGEVGEINATPLTGSTVNNVKHFFMRRKSNAIRLIQAKGYDREPLAPGIIAIDIIGQRSLLARELQRSTRRISKPDAAVIPDNKIIGSVKANSLKFINKGLDPMRSVIETCTDAPSD
ncbi:MAG: hypothetical protein WAM11_09455 [Cyanobium sp.]